MELDDGGSFMEQHGIVDVIVNRRGPVHIAI
jgi:hypothetical protein